MALFGWSRAWNGALINFIVALSISLLFLDLATLINDNSCTKETDPECPDVYFSQTYFAARHKFRESSKKAGAKLEVYPVHEEFGIEYTMDVATIFGTSNDSVIVYVTGVGGVEGFAGSAIQTQHLDTHTHQKKPYTIVHIHAVNPFGMAHFRRFNENNVELNRNFLLTAEEWEEVLNRDSNIAGYDDFEYVLNPVYDIPTLWNRYEAAIYAIVSTVKLGYTSLRRAFLTGQYHRPNGVMFGGRELQPSLKLLIKALEPYRNAKRVVAINVHCGLGRQGVQTLMVRDDEEMHKAKAIFPDEQVDIWSRETGISAGFINVRGSINYARLFETKNVVEVIQEVGTLPSLFVGRSIVLEHASYQCCRGTHAHTIIASWLRDATYVQKLSWKKNVLVHGARTLKQAEDFVESKQ